MPLSAYLKFDPWTDKVIQMKTAFEPLLSQRDKMPFEITPIYMKLSYYVAPAPPVAAPPAGVAPPDTTATPAATTAAPADTTTPAPGTTAAPATAAPPQ